MTKEAKELLLKDLCSRLPYEVRIKDFNKPLGSRIGVLLAVGKIRGCEPDVSYYPIHGTAKDVTYANISHIVPYLRPMLDMSEEEKEEERKLWDIVTTTRNDLHYLYTDFLVSHHLDYRGLIEKGLALKAPEDMYK